MAPHVDLFTPVANKGVARVVPAMEQNSQEALALGWFSPSALTLFFFFVYCSHCLLVALLRQIKHWLLDVYCQWKGAWLFFFFPHIENTFVCCLRSETPCRRFSVVAGSDLPAAPLVWSDLYSICHVKERVAFPMTAHLQGNYFFNDLMTLFFLFFFCGLQVGTCLSLAVSCFLNMHLTWIFSPTIEYWLELPLRNWDIANFFL